MFRVVSKLQDEEAPAEDIATFKKVATEGVKYLAKNIKDFDVRKFIFICIIKKNHEIAFKFFHNLTIFLKTRDCISFLKFEQNSSLPKCRIFFEREVQRVYHTLD